MLRDAGGGENIFENNLLHLCRSNKRGDGDDGLRVRDPAGDCEHRRVAKTATGQDRGAPFRPQAIGGLYEVGDIGQKCRIGESAWHRLLDDGFEHGGRGDKRGPAYPVAVAARHQRGDGRADRIGQRARQPQGATLA